MGQPGQLQKGFCGPCAPGLSSPFSGPAGGLWPSGGGRPAAQQAPGATPAPTPTPIPTCVTPSIFADCFLDCTGTIDAGSPGPVCGWTFDQPFGAFGGSISFTPGLMSFNSTAANFPGATKPLAAPLAGVFDMTVQYQFSEFSAPLGSFESYFFSITNFDNSEYAQVILDDGGNVLVTAGPAAGSDFYTGTWTPNNGAHEVHLTIDSLGVPTLFIDGVLVPLAFSFNASEFPTFPTNAVSLYASDAFGGPQSSTVSDVFVTSGVLSEGTVFCCPT